MTTKKKLKSKIRALKRERLVLANLSAGAILALIDTGQASEGTLRKLDRLAAQ